MKENEKRISLRYIVTLDRSDLARDMASEIRNRYPNMSVKESYALVDKVMPVLEGQGNVAIHEGLALQGARIAKRLYEIGDAAYPAHRLLVE